MFNVRKSLVIAITVIMMLAMVVPAAMAAPEQLHGIEIDSPTTNDPAMINADTPTAVKGVPTYLEIEFTLSIEDRQEDDVYVYAQLFNQHQSKVLEDVDPDYPGGAHDLRLVDENVLNNALIDAGILSYTAFGVTKTTDDDTPLMFLMSDVKGLIEGWYDLKVCAMEMDAPDETFKFCDTETAAVFVDKTAPKVWLDKPTYADPRHPEKGVWLTGTEYMVGGAEDNWGLDKESGEFWYCAKSNYTSDVDEVGNQRNKCGDDDTSWISIAPGAVTCTINEYGGTEFAGNWDTNEVNDDEGVIRFCVADWAGNENCSDNPVFIDNEFDIHLYPGWNLISSPLMLYDADVEDVLHHLLTLNKVEAVLAYDATSGCGSCGWTSFTPGAAPDSLKTIDHGKGYWVFMRGEGELELEGTWKSVAWETPTPAAYPVVKGWNLIGYTQWGRPTAPFFDASFAADYLANIMTPIPGVGGGVQALVKYNAATGLYKAVEYWDRMEMGKGYWLATDTAGTIVPAQW